MKKAYFVLQTYYVILNAFISGCAGTCVYFTGEKEIVCITKNNKDIGYYEKRYSKFKEGCFRELTWKDSYLKDFVSVDCSLEPYGRKSLHYDSIESFSAGNQNPSTVLQDGAFSSMQHLKKIDLSNANLEIIEEFAFYFLHKVEYLDLSNNRIKVLEVGVINPTFNVLHLNLSSNRIKNLPRAIFKNLQSMQYLDLSANRITTLHEGTFDNTLNLRKLYIHSNSISSLPRGLFHNLKYLSDLRLDKNNLSSMGYFPFSNLTSLYNLNISHNHLKTMENVFRGNHELRDLDASGNAIAAVSKSVFRETSSLRAVLLSNNRLEKITPAMFGTLRNLTYVVLSNNQIAELEDRPFQNNSQLFYLDLSKNKLSKLSDGEFRNLHSLTKLFLDSNPLDNPPFMNFILPSKISIGCVSYFPYPYAERILKCFPHETQLSMRHTNLKNLHNLSESTYTGMLDISGNPGLVLRHDTFVKFSYLFLLRMEECEITSIPRGIFVYSLLFLFLSKNRIHVIEPGAFEGFFIGVDLSHNKLETMNLELFRNIKSLNLSHNRIHVVKDMTVSNKTSYPTLGYTIELDLSFNILKEYKVDRPELQYFNISHNLIASLDDVFFKETRLQYLDISYNKLSVITKGQWKKISKVPKIMAANNDMTEITIPSDMNVLLESNSVTSLHLERNNVKRIRLADRMVKYPIIEIPETLSFKSSDLTYLLIAVYVTDNPITCDCLAYELFNYLNNYNSSLHLLEIYDVVCYQPPQLRGRALKGLQPTDMTCDFVANPSSFQCGSDCDCLKNCTCLYRPHDGHRTVNCSHGNHRNLPFNVPEFTNLLDMDHNNLGSLAELNQPRWENLVEIRAANNAIVSADFDIPRNVHFLGLRGNKLRKFPVSIKAHAEMVKDFKVTLSENPWPCDCSVRPLKRFLRDYGDQVIDNAEVTCTLLNSSTAVLTKFDDNELCLPLQKTEVHAATYVVGFLLIVALVVSYLYYNCKTYVLVFSYTHCNGCYRFFCCDRRLDDDKLYDAFVSYSSADTDVALGLMRELEEKPPHFKLCIHERDWMPGLLISDNIFHSVESSRKTLVVVSETYLQSQWFRLEFQAAFRQTLEDRRDRLILILKGDLPESSQLPRDLRFVLATKTYLKWGEKWFYDKLRYALHEERPFYEEDPGSGNGTRMKRLGRRRRRRPNP